MKKLVITLIIIISTLLTQNISIAQNDKPVRLLENWFGSWKGTLVINNVSGTISEVPMELSISETETPLVWNWIIEYGEPGQLITREYLLKAVDSEKGTYILDERNGILLDFYNAFNTFYCSFSVNDNLISAQYKLENGSIQYEIISSGMSASNITNDSATESELVYSYPIKIVQKAILFK